MRQHCCHLCTRHEGRRQVICRHVWSYGRCAVSTLSFIIDILRLCVRSIRWIQLNLMRSPWTATGRSTVHRQLQNAQTNTSVECWCPSICHPSTTTLTYNTINATASGRQESVLYQLAVPGFSRHRSSIIIHDGFFGWNQFGRTVKDLRNIPRSTAIQKNRS